MKTNPLLLSADSIAGTRQRGVVPPPYRTK